MSLSSMLAGAAVRVATRYYLRRPDQEELARLKLPTLGAVMRQARNELAFRLGRETSPKLTSLNVEVTNACNLSCTFCPVNNGMLRPKALMEVALFQHIIDDNPGLEFVLPFQWGEPLLHPRLFEMIAYARDRGVRTMITTNGTLLSKKRIEQILESGLTRITFSIDGSPESHERIRGFPLAQLEESLLALKRRRDELESPLRIDASMVIDSQTEPHFAAYLAKWRGIVDRLQAIPRFEPRPRSTPCREPWRGSLVVLANGDVTVCCADYEGSAVFGNVRETRIADLWNGPFLREFRRRHTARDFPDICKNCNEYETPHVSPRFS